MEKLDNFEQLKLKMILDKYGITDTTFLNLCKIEKLEELDKRQYNLFLAILMNIKSYYKEGANNEKY